MAATHTENPAFDPNEAAAADGIFGLPPCADEARVRLLPVPFEATCSYRRGTAAAPESIRRASRQVDLWDPHLGPVFEVGIHMDAIDARLRTWNAAACDLAAPIVAHGRPDTADLARKAERVNDISARRTALVEEWTREQIAGGRIPGIVGGDHSCALGAIRAAQELEPMSVLQFDAHLDLRTDFEGFAESHASIMRNVLAQCPRLSRLVQIGIRDFCDEERDLAVAEERVRTHYWHEWCRAWFRGDSFDATCGRALSDLTERVWVSFDIDGLDPSLCPGTGTPVPGGFDFDQASHVLHRLHASGRRVCGFDLCEVGNTEWDGNVGARILYKLCGLARGTR